MRLRSFGAARPWLLLMLTCAVLLLSGPTSAPADDLSRDPQAYLARARELCTLQAKGSTPYRLLAHIEASVHGKQLAGDYGMVWLSEDRWREELKFAEFQRLRIGAPGGFQQVRTPDYSHPIIFDLDQAFDEAAALDLEPNETVQKLKSRKLHGALLDCARIQKDRKVDRELCFDPSSGSLLHSEPHSSWFNQSADPLIIDYADPQAFAEKLVPRHIHGDQGGWARFDIAVTSLESRPTVSEAALTPPANSEFWPICHATFVTAQAKHTKGPDFPAAARQGHLQGSVSLYAQIDPDGSISHLFTLQAGSRDFEAAARKAVQQWSYNPATCDGKPIRAETLIDVTFSPQ